MCVILDVNAFGRFKKDPVNEDMKPVHQLVSKEKVVK